MQEYLLQYIWKQLLFNTKDLTTTNGNALQIIDNGRQNKNGGPDFCNAKIKMDDVIFVGNIEIHIYASTWKQHKHHLDKKYNNVILHVVLFNDESIADLPTLELNGRISSLLLKKYEEFQQSEEVIICKNLLDKVDDFTIEKWKERILVERLERKTKEILNSLENNNNDWEQTAYQLVGKYFGSHINKEPFEQLTQLLDFKILLKHQDNLVQIEALLFGVAGFLNKDFVESYPRALKQEFSFLKQKYNLKSLQEHQWQFLRIRPISFPTIRLAWFAKIIQHFPIMQQMLSEQSIEFLDEIEVSDYWSNHYVFEKWSKPISKLLGNDFKSILKINVFVPLSFAYAKYIDDAVYAEQVFDVLQNIKPENNTKTQLYDKHKWHINSAYDTQALLELHDNYCLLKKCIDCTICHSILSTTEASEFAKLY